MAKTADLTLERMNRLGRQVDALAEGIAGMSRLLALQLGDVHHRLDRIEARLGGVEALVRGYASEQLLLANSVLGAEQQAAQVHRRIDEIEERA